MDTYYRRANTAETCHGAGCSYITTLRTYDGRNWVPTCHEHGVQVIEALRVEDEPIPYLLADPSPLPYAPLTLNELLDRKDCARNLAGISAILAGETGDLAHVTEQVPEQARLYREYDRAAACRIGA